jgi:D-alanyl-D-alanine carboxypeptidase
MGDASFGPMWPNSNPNVVTLVRSDGLRLSIHKELVSLVRMLMDLTERMGYDIHPGETWGYANRPISGTSTPSNHSQATAIDINAPANPYASASWHRANARGTKPYGLRIVCDIPQAVVTLWKRYGFGWGGQYDSYPDPMHFEYEGSVTSARRHTIALKHWLDNEGVWTMGAEQKLDRLIQVTESQTSVIQNQGKLNRRADLKRELREAKRNNHNTDDIIDAIAELDAEGV